ncbi:hypothetical protein [Lysobacter niastensis]|uniref:Uncharacterized protein n=1 Tax=Lysobacter niastensis TaxID=380629 RepID=A0ABS0B7N6_9GAMM|nr:hypothetical protein [Lysobacter niastensis]MBF6025036.1 hypothetical protein [Lysobacter niastensis]
MDRSATPLTVWIGGSEFHRPSPTGTEPFAMIALLPKPDTLERIERSMLGAALIAAVMWSVVQV